MIPPPYSSYKTVLNIVCERRDLYEGTDLKVAQWNGNQHHALVTNLERVGEVAHIYLLSIFLGLLKIALSELLSFLKK